MGIEEMSTKPNKVVLEEESRKESNCGFLWNRFVTASLLVALCYVSFYCLMKEMDNYAMMNVRPVETVGTFNWGCPPDRSKNSLHDELWCENLDLINASFESDFIQGILLNTLSDESFDDVELEQAYFSLSVAQKVLEKGCNKRKKLCSDDLESLMKGFDQAYEAFGSDVFTVYGIGLEDMEPSAASREYVRFMKSVQREHSVEYVALVVAADVRIYYELAQRLKNKGVLYLDNPHKHWVSYMLETESLLSEATRFIDGARDVYNLDTVKALYRETLQKNLPMLEVNAD